MKTGILRFLIVLLLLGSRASAQSPISASDLTIPTSPGLSLADKSPSAIEKPSNPKALSLSLLDLWQGGAVEFNPYYLKPRPHYTFDDLYNDKLPVFKTIGLSAATTKTDSGTSFAAGFRTQLIRLYAKGKADAVKTNIQSHLVSGPGGTPNLSLLTNDLQELRDILSKPVFDIELAGAYLGTSNNDSYKNLAAKKWGAWLNIMWNPKSFPLTFVAITRYSSLIGAVMKGKSDSAYFDYGLSASFAQKSFDIAAEFVQRNDLIYNANYHRFTFTGNIRVTSNIILVAAIGKNFDKVQNILTVFGVKFGLSKEQVGL